jgi:hypothetical protein
MGQMKIYDIRMLCQPFLVVALASSKRLLNQYP